MRRPGFEPELLPWQGSVIARLDNHRIPNKEISDFRVSSPLKALLYSSIHNHQSLKSCRNHIWNKYYPLCGMNDSRIFCRLYEHYDVFSQTMVFLYSLFNHLIL